MSYNFVIQYIDKLSDITKNQNIHYVYKDINFLLKSKKDNKKLIVLFHGAVRPNNDNLKRIVFRGYNYEINNCDILSLSDGLMNKYKDYVIGWFLSSKKYNFDEIYQEIINEIIKHGVYEKVIFTGTSAGGYPAIKYASIFNGHCLVSNSQLYLDKYNKMFSGYNLLNDMLKENDDEIIYDGIENILLDNRARKIVIYCNTYDYTYYVDLIKLLKFIGSNEIKNIEIRLFEDCDSDDKLIHQIMFPNKKTYGEILCDYVN
jgi:hypothetical protein